VNPQGSNILARIALTTSTGSVQLWLDNKVQWTREEGLSEIVLAEFVELPEKKLAASATGEDGETFMQRLLRQVSDAQVNIPVPDDIVTILRLICVEFSAILGFVCEALRYWVPRFTYFLSDRQF
jgi:hypothetical protein